MKFKNWFDCLLIESKQSIIGLRYPEIIAKLLYKRFGNSAFTIAKWFREYRFSREIPDNWWLQTMGDLRRTPSLYDLTFLYAAASTNDPEQYLKALDKLELSRDDYVDLEEQRKALQAQIEARFFDDAFFSYTIISDIISKKLKDIAPYKQLNFWDAQHKYDEKNIFKDTIPVKTYRNGFKWINVGKRCTLVGSLMRNCGSAGLMSMESGASMIVLFGPENTPHVVVTHSPKENRLSGDEGGASTEVKSKYHEYILDLAKILGATFDAHKSKSSFLKMKYMLQGKATGIRQINPKDDYDKLFMFNMQGKTFYANAYVMVSKEDVDKVQNAIQQGTLTLVNKQRSLIKNIFNHRNQPMLADFGIKYIRLTDL